QSAVRFASYSDYAERLRELVFQAMKRRLRTLHPVGVAVSGGLDSSIVLCVADQLRRVGAIPSAVLPVSLTAPDRGTGEECRFLSLLESKTGLRIERMPYGAPGELADLDQAAWHSEWPRFDDGWFAQRAM